MSVKSIKICLSLLMLCLISVFVFWYIGQEKYIYFWDNLNFFNLYKELATNLLQKPFKAIDSINISVRKADYNNLGTVPLLPFYYLFGGGRLPYIIAVSIVYGFSTIVFFPKLLAGIYNSESSSKLNKLPIFLIGIISLGLLPQFWVPILLGYYDVAGVGVIFVILYLYFRENLAEKSIKQLIILGLLLTLLIILRRWYAYWVVGFFAAMIAQQIWSVWQKKSEIKTSLKNILIIALTSLLSFVALATQNFVKMLTTNYADIYSAAKISNGYFQIFERFYDHFGLITLLLCLFGLITMFAKKDLRQFGFFLTILFVVTFYTFTKTQDVDFHQYYWVISIFIIFIAVFLVSIYQILPNIWLKVCFATALTIYSFANFSIVFFPNAENNLQAVSFALTKTRLYPKVRNDLEQIKQLLLTLNDLTKDSEKKVYVLSSSVTLNSSILQSGCNEFDGLQNLQKRILTSSDIDKRDGFPFQIYQAEYVVIANPIGYHLQPNDQKVIGFLAEKILNGQDIGEAFTKLPFEFTLEDNRRVFIYQKTRKFRAEELTKMSEIFVGFYPNNKEKFEIKPELLKQLSEN